MSKRQIGNPQLIFNFYPMQNKENNIDRPMGKTNKIVIGVVGTLVVISFIVLKISSLGKQEVATNKNTETIATTTEKKTAGQLNIQPISTADHLLGSVEAPVKIIVYSEFECPYCQHYSETIKQVKKDFGDQVAIAFRHFPMPETSANALLMAIGSECAAEQNKFWEMHDELFLANKEKRLYSDELINMATKIGLDQKQFQDCISADRAKDKVIAQYKEGGEAGVIGAPTTFINGKLYTGDNPYEDVTKKDGTVILGLKNIITANLNGQ